MRQNAVVELTAEEATSSNKNNFMLLSVSSNVADPEQQECAGFSASRGGGTQQSKISGERPGT